MELKMIQDKIFELSESDNWFSRNKKAILDRTPDKDLITGIISKLENKNKIKSVIELGSTNGYRLNFLKSILPECKTFVGVDASNEAVKDGISRYGLEMHKATIDKIELDKKFDLVIVNFVYHWIDRENIFKAISCTDNLLNDKGCLIVGDFMPDFPQKRFYHHTPDKQIYTYKTDYSKIFQSTNTYKEIYRTTYNHDDIDTASIQETNSGNRGFCSVLRKDLYGYYHEF